MENGVLLPELNPKYGFVTSVDGYIKDKDGDGIEERMFKFDPSEVQDLVGAPDNIELTINGELLDGTFFKLSDTIRVIDP